MSLKKCQKLVPQRQGKCETPGETRIPISAISTPGIYVERPGGGKGTPRSIGEQTNIPHIGGVGTEGKIELSEGWLFFCKTLWKYPPEQGGAQQWGKFKAGSG